MFRAAATVGTATRLLQVFYGLSQAGRAIAAAAVDLKAEDWRLDGHGVKARGLDQDLPEIEIRTDPATSRGSFVRLSRLLDSPVWEKDPVRFEDVWDILPVNLDYPLTDRNRYIEGSAGRNQRAGPPWLRVRLRRCSRRFRGGRTRGASAS